MSENSFHIVCNTDTLYTYTVEAKQPDNSKMKKNYGGSTSLFPFCSFCFSQPFPNDEREKRAKKIVRNRKKEREYEQIHPNIQGILKWKLCIVKHVNELTHFCVS